MVDEIVVGFEDPRVLKAGEPEARLWSSLPNREPVAHQNPGAMVSEPTRRASWIRHVESDSPPSGNRPRVTISGTRYKYSGLRLAPIRKDGIDLARAVRMENVDLLSHGTRCRLNVVQLDSGVRRSRPYQHTDDLSHWNKIAQQRQPLPFGRGGEHICAGRVSFRPVEIGDKAELDRISTGKENDRNCCCGCLGRED